MAKQKSSTVLTLIRNTLLVVGLLAAGPAWANGVFVSAGGPYEADVGEEIEFDASGSYLFDGSEIEAYYWDWYGDGHFECFTTPTAKHTWHSAWSGLVRVYVFYDEVVDANGITTEAKLDWADAWVTITGPDTALQLTLGSSAELHLRDERGRCIGIDPVTGLFEMEIPGTTIEYVPEATGPAQTAADSDTDWATRYTIPLCTGSCYDITLTGTEDGGEFELCVQGLQDGKCDYEETFRSSIHADEEIRLEIEACCEDGDLDVSCSGLIFCPELSVDPDDKIELIVQPGGRYEATITIGEEDGLRELCGVVLTCTELTGVAYTIPASDISFSANGFNVAAGAEQKVVMTVDVPEFFVGQVTGTLTVACKGGQREEIDVIVRKVGAHAPLVEVVSPVSGTVGAPVEFDATGSYDPDGSIEDYCWDWDLSGQYECVDDPVCEHTWYTTFNGVVRLRVVDDEGNATEKYVQVVITE